MKAKNLMFLIVFTLQTPLLMAQETNYAQRDNDVHFVAQGLLTMRNDLPVEVSKAYWRDVHGVLGSQIAGIYQYWQHHLGRPVTGIWPMVEGILYETPPNRAINGMSEITFLKAEDAESLGTDPHAAQLEIDEQNIFGHTAIQNSLRVKTFVDKIENGMPNGPQQLTKFILLIRRNPNKSTADFREYMKGLATDLSEEEALLKLRMHLLEPYDDTAWAPINVNHKLPKEEQYGAILEIGFQDRMQMRSFFASEGFEASTGSQASFIKSIYTFPEEEIYTLNYDGSSTMEGLRSYPVMKTINTVGAANQVSAALLRLLYNGYDKK